MIGKIARYLVISGLGGVLVLLALAFVVDDQTIESIAGPVAPPLVSARNSVVVPVINYTNAAIDWITAKTGGGASTPSSYPTTSISMPIPPPPETQRTTVTANEPANPPEAVEPSAVPPATMDSGAEAMTTNAIGASAPAPIDEPQPSMPSAVSEPETSFPAATLGSSEANSSEVPESTVSPSQEIETLALTTTPQITETMPEALTVVDPNPAPAPAPVPVAPVVEEPVEDPGITENTLAENALIDGSDETAALPPPPPNPEEQSPGEADYQSGLRFYSGEGVDRNFGEAAQFFLKAAEVGHIDAQYNLGIMNYIGQTGGQDFANAAKWFLQAASNGHAEAQYSLGFLYYEGKGVEQDLKTAFDWISRSADQGYPKAIQARDAFQQAMPESFGG